MYGTPPAPKAPEKLTHTYPPTNLEVSFIRFGFAACCAHCRKTPRRRRPLPPLLGISIR